MISESIDIETETETESLTESQPSSSGIENNNVTRIQFISKQNTTSGRLGLLWLCSRQPN